MDILIDSINNQNRPQACRLRKSIYSLKQSPRAWFQRFNRAVIKHEFKQAQSNHTLFTKFTGIDNIIIILVCVDDIILTGNDLEGIKIIKEQLSLELEIKDLRKLRYFVSMKVGRTNDGMRISHKKYIIDML